MLRMRTIAVLAGALILAGAGCAMLPPPPAGPPVGPGQISYAMTFGLNSAPATATVVTDDGTHHAIGGNADIVTGKYDLLGTLANPRMALRYAPTARLDVGGYAGGWDAGGAIRRFLNDDPLKAAVPVALSLGAQVGYSLFFERQPLGRPWQVQAGLEFHPFVRGYGSSLLGLSASYGRRRHALLVPVELIPTDQGDPFPLTHTDFEITRPELRLELSLGTVILGARKAVATFTVMPYVVLGAGPARGGCACAGHPRLETYDQTWGIAFVVGPFAVLDPAANP